MPLLAGTNLAYGRTDRDIWTISPPISTLLLPTNEFFPRRVYIIRCLTLAKTVFRSEDVYLEPLFTDVPARATHFSAEARLILDKAGTRGNESCRQRMLDADREGFKNDNIRRLTSASLDRVLNGINKLGARDSCDNLFSWILREITIATSYALFGPDNPLENKENRVIEDPLSTFRQNSLWLVAARLRAYRIRANLRKDYSDYHLSAYDQKPKVSNIIQKRGNIYRCKYIHADDVGRLHLSLLEVATEELVATTFLMLVHIAADPDATEIIRNNLQNAIVKFKTNGKTTAILKVSKLDHCCPLLTSAYFEALRLVNSRVRTRRVIRDTEVLDGTRSYVLRAGAAIHVTAASSNMSSVIWKNNAASFHKERFLARGMSYGSAQTPLHEQMRALFPFASKSLPFPGEDHAFALACAIFAALIVSRDITGEDGKPFQLPETYQSELAKVVANPYSKDSRIGATLTQREEEWQNVDFKFVL
ncbi:cytochrome P450 [Hyaloscypha variabilis F]|uniref:Cytochrome P450 n=1 Tax=Hyaloscypha variabilis (strain UAMH 11265 / GT02V1 / F) TaxID=1149755 RepID=A0A2J6S937_HYAVF|nr:cytochrome P450 [Hyaloscypha variabilis F]